MNERLTVLDAQRGLCALFVALAHAQWASHASDWSFVQGSWLFVDFFFVLSGFVIALVYLDRIGDAPSLLAFVARRFGRLWPLHAFVLLLFVAIEGMKTVAEHVGMPVHAAAFADARSIGPLAANLLLVHSLGIYDSFSWNAPSWSISVEFYTYLVFAGLCIAVRRWMVTAAVMLVGASILILLLCAPARLMSALDFGIFRGWYGFFLGVLTLLGYRAVCARCRTLPMATPLEALSIAVAVVIVLVGSGGGAVTMFAPIVFAAVVFVFAFEAGRLSRLLQMRAFTWLGERSYAIYMMHVFVGSVLGFSLLRVPVFAAAPVQNAVATGAAVFAGRFLADACVIMYLLAVVASAHLVHQAIERPGRAFFNRLAAAYLRRHGHDQHYAAGTVIPVQRGLPP
jgi:peptidoglycan/LPS O-acetylase OafA/YrhL